MVTSFELANIGYGGVAPLVPRSDGSTITYRYQTESGGQIAYQEPVPTVTTPGTLNQTQWLANIASAGINAVKAVESGVTATRQQMMDAVVAYNNKLISQEQLNAVRASYAPTPTPTEPTTITPTYDPTHGGQGSLAISPPTVVAAANVVASQPVYQPTTIPSYLASTSYFDAGKYATGGTQLASATGTPIYTPSPLTDYGRIKYLQPIVEERQQALQAYQPNIATGQFVGSDAQYADYTKKIGLANVAVNQYNATVERFTHEQVTPKSVTPLEGAMISIVDPRVMANEITMLYEKALGTEGSQAVAEYKYRMSAGEGVQRYKEMLSQPIIGVSDRDYVGIVTRSAVTAIAPPLAGLYSPEVRAVETAFIESPVTALIPIGAGTKIGVEALETGTRYVAGKTIGAGIVGETAKFASTKLIRGMTPIEVGVGVGFAGLAAYDVAQSETVGEGVGKVGVLAIGLPGASAGYKSVEGVGSELTSGVIRGGEFVAGKIAKQFPVETMLVKDTARDVASRIPSSEDIAEALTGDRKPYRTEYNIIKSEYGKAVSEIRDFKTGLVQLSGDVARTTSSGLNVISGAGGRITEAVKPGMVEFIRSEEASWYGSKGYRPTSEVKEGVFKITDTQREALAKGSVGISERGVMGIRFGSKGYTPGEKPMSGMLSEYYNRPIIPDKPIVPESTKVSSPSSEIPVGEDWVQQMNLGYKSRFVEPTKPTFHEPTPFETYLSERGLTDLTESQIERMRYDFEKFSTPPLQPEKAPIPREHIRQVTTEEIPSSKFNIQELFERKPPMEIATEAEVRVTPKAEPVVESPKSVSPYQEAIEKGVRLRSTISGQDYSLRQKGYTPGEKQPSGLILDYMAKKSLVKPVETPTDKLYTPTVSEEVAPSGDDWIDKLNKEYGASLRGQPTEPVTRPAEEPMTMVKVKREIVPVTRKLTMVKERLTVLESIRGLEVKAQPQPVVKPSTKTKEDRKLISITYPKQKITESTRVFPKIVTRQKNATESAIKTVSAVDYDVLTSTKPKSVVRTDTFVRTVPKTKQATKVETKLSVYPTTKTETGLDVLTRQETKTKVTPKTVTETKLKLIPKTDITTKTVPKTPPTTIFDIIAPPTKKKKKELDNSGRFPERRRFGGVKSRRERPWHPAALEYVTTEEMTTGKLARHVRPKGVTQELFKEYATTGRPIPTAAQFKKRGGLYG